MIQKQFELLLEKWLTQQSSEAEQQAFMDVITNEANHTMIIESMDRFFAQHTTDVTSTQQQQLALQQLLGKIRQPGINITREPPVRSLRTSWIKYAAAIIILAGTGTYLWNTQKEKPTLTETANPYPVKNDVQAPQATRATITLADGSIITLDSTRDGRLATQGAATIDKKAGSIIYAAPIQQSPVTGEVTYNTLTNPRGSQVVSLELSDGSKVWLNSESSITYPASFQGDAREVAVTGEAYFEVTHDKTRPFKVKRNEVLVTVLGTKFNVHAYADESQIKVTLLQGSVAVEKNNERKIIKPHQQAAIADNIRVLNAVDEEQVMAWKNGRFRFGNSSLEDVMKQVSRWYDVQIEYEGNNRNKHFTGGISRQSEVSKVLNMLAATEAIKYRIEGKHVTVTLP